MKLTLAKIKTLPIGKKISDGQGLCLTKTAPNKGRWEHRYMINKRARVMALGTYPEIPLIKARHIHFEQRQLLVEGKDPLEQNTAVKNVNAATQPFVFRTWQRCVLPNRNTIGQIKSMPMIGARPLNDLPIPFLTRKPFQT